MRKQFMIAGLGLCLGLGLCGCGKDTRKTDQEAYRQYGLNCMQDGDYAGAVDAFQKGLDQSRGTVGSVEMDLCYYKAEAQYLSGDTDGALATYDALIDYNKDADAYYLRGCIELRQEDVEDALTDFSSAVSRDKKNYELYISISDVLGKNGYALESEEYLNQALEISGEKAYDKLEKGKIYYLLEDYDSAETLLTAAVEKENVEANYYLGMVYEQKGDEATAETYFATYLDAGIADSTDLCSMAEMQMELENYDHAVEYLNAALELDTLPNKSSILKDLVTCYEAKREFANAREAMEEYLEICPDDQAAQREMTFLSTR